MKSIGQSGPRTPAEHYEALLAEHYTWMFGMPFEAKVAEQRQLLQRLGIRTARRDARAVDLGCGPGFQSLALAGLGFSVTAVDTSARLLDELRAHAGTHPIHAVQGDLLESARHAAAGSAAVVVCMGDTLTHLDSRAAIARLFHDVARILEPGGAFVLTWRDLGTELHGTDRFILVNGDPDRVMTCFLEYTSEDVVIVHDLIHRREADGRWTLLRSSYPKLRLPASWVVAALEGAGLALEHQSAGRMTEVVARRAV